MKTYNVKNRAFRQIEVKISKINKDSVECLVGDKTIVVKLVEGQFFVGDERFGKVCIGDGIGMREVIVRNKQLYVEEHDVQSQGTRFSGIAKRRVRAEMPGRVVKVLVNVGQQVDVGQGVVILEAMKMENEVKATRSGKIRTIHVKEGDRVEGGAILVEFE